MARIPSFSGMGKETKKIDVIGQHLTTSIKLIAMECDPLSTHVLVMACDEMIISMARFQKLSLRWDYKNWIKEEYHKDYRQLANNAYNYSKHADRDPDEPYTGPPTEKIRRLNEIKTFLSMRGFLQIGGQPGPALSIYNAWMFIRHPAYFNLDLLHNHPGLKKAFEDIRNDSEIHLVALRDALFKNGTLPPIPDKL